MPNQFKEKKNAIKQLEKSAVFSDKDFFFKLLYYLVEAEEQKKTLKSTTIAIELLDNEDGVDITVRFMPPKTVLLCQLKRFELCHFN